MAIAVVVPWGLAIAWGKGQPDTLVAIGLALATPILLFVGILVGVAGHASRLAKYDAAERAEIEDLEGVKRTSSSATGPAHESGSTSRDVA